MRGARRLCRVEAHSEHTAGRHTSSKLHSSHSLMSCCCCCVLCLGLRASSSVCLLRSGGCGVVWCCALARWWCSVACARVRARSCACPPIFRPGGGGGGGGGAAALCHSSLSLLSCCQQRSFVMARRAARPLCLCPPGPPLPPMGLLGARFPSPSCLPLVQGGLCLATKSASCTCHHCLSLA